eukprot:CAMPEP_0183380858 /NCGR_PEP_ID=MMETSP0164_2-20130417/126146_1 /TAXON_ID=221442 /ORGANISM="Coccolithus pelagicus ssp braarudi, Strain PLY182g" /LENGTH=43 /DNA_ID= /DNA_START= /DNA_END= /DNA_ORIENTATION=
MPYAITGELKERLGCSLQLRDHLDHFEGIEQRVDAHASQASRG